MIFEIHWKAEGTYKIEAETEREAEMTFESLSLCENDIDNFEIIRIDNLSEEKRGKET